MSRNDVVIVSCISRGDSNYARAKAKGRTATASCTSGAEFAVKAAALKLLGGGESSLKAECIEDNRALPHRTKWRVTG